MAIPPVALFASRVRRSATTEVAAITETTAEFAPVAPADFDSFGFDALDFDIISRAS